MGDTRLVMSGDLHDFPRSSYTSALKPSVVVKPRTSAERLQAYALELLGAEVREIQQADQDGELMYVLYAVCTLLAPESCLVVPVSNPRHIAQLGIDAKHWYWLDPKLQDPNFDRLYAPIPMAVWEDIFIQWWSQNSTRVLSVGEFGNVWLRVDGKEPGREFINVDYPNIEHGNLFDTEILHRLMADSPSCMSMREWARAGGIDVDSLDFGELLVDSKAVRDALHVPEGFVPIRVRNSSLKMVGLDISLSAHPLDDILKAYKETPIHHEPPKQVIKPGDFVSGGMAIPFPGESPDCVLMFHNEHKVPGRTESTLTDPCKVCHERGRHFDIEKVQRSEHLYPLISAVCAMARAALTPNRKVFLHGDALPHCRELIEAFANSKFTCEFDTLMKDFNFYDRPVATVNMQVEYVGQHGRSVHDICVNTLASWDSYLKMHEALSLRVPKLK